MKIKKIILLGSAIFAMTFIGCQKDDVNDLQVEKTEEQSFADNNALYADPELIPDEFVDVKLPNDGKWGYTPHRDMMYAAAIKCGLSYQRADKMKEWAAYPDQIDGEANIPIISTTWKHGYMYKYYVHYYGIADAMCKNNISGSGYNGKSAFYYYPGNKDMGDKYVGYAGHYMIDMGNSWHTWGLISQTDHYRYETWFANNWTSGHKFYQYILNNGSGYYSVTDPAAATRSVAWNSMLSAQSIYNAWLLSGRPTGAGTGNSTLISKTKANVLRSFLYLKGLVYYTLNHENAW